MQIGFLSGDSECSAIIRSIDWSKNPLGAIEHWPQSLRTTLSILLNSKFPKFLYWGSDLICFYNDAYRPSLGNNGKHPSIMGTKAKDAWPEIWDIISPMIETVLAGGEATWSEDQLIPIYRNGKIEDAYWTFSYSAVYDESDKPAGVYCTCTETTKKIETLEELNESKNELEFAINAVELATFDLNPLTGQFKANKRLKQWFGLPHKEHVDLGIAIDVIIEEDRERVQQAINKSLLFESGGTYSIRYTIRNSKTGEKRIVDARGLSLFDEQQVAIRFSGTLQDVTEEVKIQTAFKESEENFRNLILQAPIGMVILKEENFIIELVNDAYLQIAGKNRKDLENKSLWDAMPEIKTLGFEHILKNVLKTGATHQGNEQPLTLIKNGVKETMYINYVYEPLKDKDGFINRIMVVAVDVTEILESKHKIQDTEERARLAIVASGLGTFDLNIKTDELKTSDRFNEVFGFTSTVNRKDVVDAMHKDDLAIRLNALRRAIQTGQVHYEVRVNRKDASICWIRIEGKIYYEGDDKPVRVLGTVMDITEQRNAKEELIRINQRLKIALETGSLGFYELDLDTKKAIFSDQFYKNFGFSASGMLEYSEMVNSIAPNFKNAVLLQLDKSISEKSLFQTEYQIIWPDESLHWIRETGRAQYDHQNNPISFISVSFDITETKELQRQKDDFIGIASHELKTPVTSVKAYAQVLEKILTKKGDLREASLMKKMDAQLNRLTSLIGDLLDVTKVNAGKLQYNRVNFDFNEMIRNAIEEIQHTTEKHQLVERLEEVGLVYADQERISQVVINLITNAIKYSPNSDSVIVHTSLDGENVLVCIEDFGIGIADDNVNKVFEQFYRVSGTMQHTFPGLGLGLYISSEIIKREGGKIWVDSKKDSGSRFYFSIPKNNNLINIK